MRIVIKIPVPALRVILVKVQLSKHVVEIKVDIVPEIDNE